MPAERSDWKVLTVIVAFFGIGTAIGWWVTFKYVSSGGAVAPGVTIGAFYGGIAAWIIFFAAGHTVRWIRGVISRGRSTSRD